MRGQYDPHKHHRRSTRLRGWDYSTPGIYFVTICTHERQNLFANDRFRQVVANAWQAIPNHPHARHVDLDEWVVMPNHVHGILVLVEEEGEAETGRGRGEAGRDGGPFPSEPSLRPASPLHRAHEADGVKPGSVGAIVGNFKSLAARRINNLRRTPGGRVWQRGYYDRIVRNERELNAIRQYIRNNPRRWTEDRENLERLTARMRQVD